MIKKICFILSFNVFFSSCFFQNKEQKEKEFVIKAKENISKNHLDSAIYFYEQAYGLNPDNLYLINIGGLYNELHMPNRAIGYLERALQVDSSNAIVFNNRAMSYKLLGDINNAILDLKKSLEVNPDFNDARIGLSELYYKEKEYRLAIKYLNELLIKEPQNYSYLFHRGKSYEYLKMHDEALRDFNEIIQNQNDSLKFEVLNSRALIYSVLNKFDSAIIDLKKSLYIRHDQQSTVNLNLASIYLNVYNNKDSACKYIKRHHKIIGTKITNEILIEYCGKTE